MDQEPQQIDIARYLRFVIAFLILLFGVLGVYQHYYGSEARELQSSQEGDLIIPGSGVQDAADTAK